MKKLLLILPMCCSILLTVSAQTNRQWATYYGGTDDEGANNITTDAAGNVYICGQTYSTTGIATPGSYQSIYGGGSGDAYLVKYNSAGVRLWATYYGGAASDYGVGVKADGSGNVYLIGYTSSATGIATAGAYQTVNSAGSVDAFLVKFDSNGNRLWATYYGGPDYDQANNVTTDASGNAYITGFTVSTTGIATAGAYQTAYSAMSDGFLAKFSSTGSLVWGTYYGDAGDDYTNDVATDLFGNVIICGTTTSTSGIASAGAFQTAFAGQQDGFVAEFNSAGSRLWATYYGGAGIENGSGVATSPIDGSVYLAGYTTSVSGIASGGFQNTYGGGSLDAFLVKFNSTGTRLWATYYGGVNIEEGNDVATDNSGNVYLAGDTYSPNTGNCIATPNGYQTNINGTENQFVTGFTSAGARINASYYGQIHEEATVVAVSSTGDIYTAGWTFATSGIASPGGFQNSFGGGQWDAFLVKFASSDSTNAVPTLSQWGLITLGLLMLSFGIFYMKAKPS